MRLGLRGIIRHALVAGGGIRVLLVRVHHLIHLGILIAHHSLHRSLIRVVLCDRSIEGGRVGGAIEAVGLDAVQLEPDAGRARPCVRRRGIAFDLSPPAALTCSHHCVLLAPRYTTAVLGIRTLQSLVTVVLIHEDIIYSAVRKTL